MNFASLLFLLTVSVPYIEPFGFGGSSGPLYSENDIGITILDVKNFKETVLHSSTAWMVEFYSSWCGHCIRFAPTFKELATYTDGWKSIFKVGAIDCAQDENVPICRNYDIMGYPSLKFFPPNSSDTEMGKVRESFSQNIDIIMDDMANYMGSLASNISLNAVWKQHNWPNFTYISYQETGSILNDKNIDRAILIAEPDDSSMGYYTIMEMYSLLPKNSPIIVRRGLSSDLTDILSEVQATHKIAVISLKNGQEEGAVNSLLYESPEIKSTKTWMDLRSVLRNYVRKNKAVVENSRHHEGENLPKKSKENIVAAETDVILPETHEAEIKRRRYTAYMSDLENAILNTLTHEIGARSSIVGPALHALQDYTEVLSRHFPGRPATMTLLHELFQWVIGHEDMIRGEDLIAKIIDLRAAHGTFADLPTGRWVGCKGSGPTYGGYPCSLWTLWHVLTVNQDKDETPPSKVLDTMVGYVRHFFGCEDCSRHFLDASENGDAIKRDVIDKNSSILWLWKFHNRVNKRLSGDITDDKRFPKETFPNKQHCTECYNNRLGTDLWNEFNHEKVLQFLEELYGSDHLDYHGLKDRSGPPKKEAQTHDLEIYHHKKDDEDQIQDHKRYTSKDQGHCKGLWFWGPIDFSLCFSIYLLSALIIMVVYFKFVAKRKPCFGLSQLFQQQRRHEAGQNSMV